MRRANFRGWLRALPSAAVYRVVLRLRSRRGGSGTAARNDRSPATTGLATVRPFHAERIATSKEGGTRTVTFQADDGGNVSDPVSREIEITP